MSGHSFIAAAVTKGQGPAFVYAEPAWQLSPGGPSGAHVNACYYMTADDARDLAAQLIDAAAKADLANRVNTESKP